MGPLCFHLYVNKISTICKDCKIDSYVDDSKLFQGRPAWHLVGGGGEFVNFGPLPFGGRPQKFFLIANIFRKMLSMGGRGGGGGGGGEEVSKH